MRIQASSAVRVSALPAPCGFECPHCGFHHLISDEAVGKFLQQLKTGETVLIRCPECGESNEFHHSDLKDFARNRDF